SGCVAGLQGRCRTPDADRSLPTLATGLAVRFSFFVTGKNFVHALPGRQKVKASELLLQPHRLVDHPFLILVVTHLNIPRQREILAQGMALEAVIRQDTAQVRIICEIDPEQIPCLALPPSSAAEQADSRWHRLFGVGL